MDMGGGKGKIDQAVADMPCRLMGHSFAYRGDKQGTSPVTGQ
jgi:hypothetical protein